MEDFVTRHEAATLLGRSIRTVDRYLGDGTLRAVRIRKLRLVELASIEAFIDPRPLYDAA